MSKKNNPGQPFGHKNRESEKWPSNYKRNFQVENFCVSEYCSTYSQPAKTKINITKLKRGKQETSRQWPPQHEVSELQVLSGGLKGRVGHVTFPTYQTQVPKKGGEWWIKKIGCQNRKGSKRRCSMQKSKFKAKSYILLRISSSRWLQKATRPFLPNGAVGDFYAMAARE